jgi:hypothetical protein
VLTRRRVVPAVLGVMALASVVFVASLSGSGSGPSAGEIGDRFAASGTIIETPDHGPMVVATMLLESLPPQGGDIPLTDWQWAQAEALTEVKELTGTRWTATPLTVEGRWDGSTLAVDRVRVATEVPRRVETPRTCAHPADVSELMETPGAVGWSTEDAGGSRRLTVLAVGPSSRLDTTISALGDDVEVDYLLKRID